MLNMGWRKLTTSLICAIGLSAAFASPVTAASGAGEYPGSAARTFSGGAAGWSSSSSFDGTCIPPLVCPSVTNSHVASGDEQGNGFISSDYLGVVGVGGVGGTTTAVWESPTFTYSGSSGEQPGSLALSLSRRSDVGQLLAVAGNSATYAVQLVDVSEGNDVIGVIAPTTLAGANDWTTVGASIKPGRLAVGDSYRIRILTIYSTGTSVLVTGSADYDDVVLRAPASGDGNGKDGSGGKGNGGKGKNGSDGDDGRGSLRSSELLSLFGSGQPGAATLKGKRLLVRVRCPKSIGAACRVRAQGLLRKRRPATAASRVKVGRGKTRLVALRVKPRLRGKVAKRKKLLVRQKVRARGTSATVLKTRKLIRR